MVLETATGLDDKTYGRKYVSEDCNISRNRDHDSDDDEIVVEEQHVGRQRQIVVVKAEIFDVELVATPRRDLDAEKNWEQ